MAASGFDEGRVERIVSEVLRRLGQGGGNGAAPERQARMDLTPKLRALGN